MCMHVCICMYVCVHVYVCRHACVHCVYIYAYICIHAHILMPVPECLVDISEQLETLTSLLPSCGIRGLNSGCKVLQ